MMKRKILLETITSMNEGKLKFETKLSQLSLFIMIFSIDIEFNSLLISDDLKKFGNFQNSRISYNFCIKTIKQKNLIYLDKS